MKVKEKFLNPANGINIEFHDVNESFVFESPNHMIKKICEIVNQLEDYPLVYAELNGTVRDINKNFGTKQYLDNVINETTNKYENYNDMEPSNDYEPEVNNTNTPKARMKNKFKPTFG